MNLIRVFHPVGQGAFYSERYSFNNKEFTVVYDCGSTTLRWRKLENKIKSAFPEGHTIDILFISHFHADHINGIETLKKHCNIKRVVLPLLDSEAKTLVKVANMIDCNYSDTELIDNPNYFFGGNTQVIAINPTKINQDEHGISLEETIDISKTTASRFASGTAFVPFARTNWLFIPFNYKHGGRKTQFVHALRRYGLTLVDIDTTDKIQTHKSSVAKAYNDVDGDLNENSMALFSGPKTSKKVYHFQQPHRSRWHHNHFRLTLESGCLYMGDIDLTEPKIVTDLKSKLKNVISFIGTLQVPHHGSIKNFDNFILDENIQCAVFSYGTTNSYGHPSDRVISDVIANEIYPLFVTEEQSSMVTQWIAT
ncbi:MAG: MBL fold metallo-hydrolase [Fibromonadales bacterium]|nr:MBL fold metallo-hydrolase [Fibromonadales bacterium]